MSTTKLEGQVAIITGSSVGIGKAVAIALSKKGVQVVINGRNPEKLANATQELKALGISVLPIQADVSNYEDCEMLVAKTVEAYGRLDILINNAGIAMEGSIEETDPAVFEKVFSANTLGVIYPTKAALFHIKKAKGSIVFTGSIAGLLGLPNFSAYSGSKMSLTALTQSLKIELTGTGVHVGINYVGFAENPPDKTFLNKEGESEVMPKRGGFKRMPMDEIAKYFVEGIEKRRYKQTLSSLGKFTRFMQQFFPKTSEFFMIRNYSKKQKS